MLDVIVEPDLSDWHWKDEDEFQAMLDWGLLSTSEAAGVRAEADRVIERAMAGEPPFCNPWPLWTPDPAWSLPALLAHEIEALAGPVKRLGSA